MAGGFFRNTGTDLRQLIENSFLEGYRHKFIFLNEAFKYTYVRSNGYITTQTYTYNSLINELQKRNINITDIDIAPAQATPIFGVLRFTCFFKNGSKPIIIRVVPCSLEPIMNEI